MSCQAESKSSNSRDASFEKRLTLLMSSLDARRACAVAASSSEGDDTE